MLKLENISLQFSQRWIFKESDVFIGSQDKIGLVGKNGAGKTTLMKVILGEQPLDSGQVSKPKEYTIGYLPQELSLNSSDPVREEVMKAFEATRNIEKRIEEISNELAIREDYESQSYLDLAEELNRISTQLGVYGVESQDEQVERVLLGLGFTKDEFQKPLNSFSGGWRMRIALAKILLKKPNLLLLDEPTNHLDIESIEWLENYLKEYQGAILLISHDRLFLDGVTNKTIELINATVYDYPAPYSRFVELRADVIQKQRDARKNQEKEIKHTEDLINRFRAKSSKAAFAQSLMKKLDRMEIIEVDEEDETHLDFSFQPAPRSGKVVAKGEALTKKYENKTIFENLDFEILRGQKIALIGKNGVGKTTLTKVIAGLTTYQGDCELGYQVDLGYYSQNQSDELPSDLTVLEVIEREATGEYRKKVRNLLGTFMFSGDDVFKKVKFLSGGEKARIALCKLLLHSYNFLILDEPTNHLDMKSKDVLKNALLKFDGTLLIVSHDRDFLNGLTNPIMELKKGKMTVYPGTITEFLATRRAQSIREYEHEKRKTRESESRQDSQKGLSEKDKWEISKRITSLEREIEKLESEIKTMDEESSSLDYSDSVQVENHMRRLSEKRVSLEKKMEEWEKNSSILN